MFDLLRARGEEFFNQVATELMAGVPSDVVEKIMRGNARRMLSLD